MNEALPTTRSLWLSALAALLVLGLGAAASGQEAGGGQPAIADAVPTGQIGARAQALADRLEEIRAPNLTEMLEQSGRQLEDLQADATSATERLETLLAGPANPLEVEAQALVLKRLDRRFEALQHEIRDEADALDRALAEIAEQTELWKQTRAEARSIRAPPAVVRTIDQALADLASANKQVGQDLGAALQFLDRVGDARRSLRPTQERIEALQTRVTQLWVRQADPVWQSIPVREDLFALPGEIGSRLAAVAAEIAPQARERSDALVVQVLLFLALALSLARTRAARDRLHPERAETHADPLRHPWAAAYLLSILMMPFLGLEDVRGFQLVVTPLALVAWFLVLSGLVAPALRVPLVGLALLALLELFRFVLPGLPVMDRLLLGLDLGLALGALVWLRRPERLRHIPLRAAGSPWLRVLGDWMWLLVPALAGGLLAVLLGYTALADRIALFAIWGSVLGGAWAALVRVGEELAEHLVEADRLPMRMIQTSGPDVLRWLRRGLRGLGLFAWVYATLTTAGFWSPMRSLFDAVLSASIGYGTVSISLGGVLGFFLTLWLAWLVARFTSFVLDQEVFSRVRTAPGVSFALSTFTRYAILVIGFLIAMGAIGFSIDRVALLLSALGVGIGFGLQNVVNNFVSGAILLFERPIRAGDWVQVEELFGIVSRIGIRATNVRTFDGADVLVPNGDLIAARVTNWTLSDRKRRAILPVGVAYGTPPRRVLELLAEVAHAHPEVLAEPAPVVLFRGFGDSALNFEIRAFTEGDLLRVMSELAVATTEALEAAGITIPFPQRDLHLRNLPELRDALKEVSQPDGPRAHDEPSS